MLRKTIIPVVIFVFIISAGLVQAESGMQVAQVTFATAVEDRQPIGPGTSFPTTVERVYCFTAINGAEGEASVSHVWYYNDTEMARVPLSVRAAAWRTWSSKRIMPFWVGQWRVDVESADGDILTSKEFSIASP
ncbi:hypothetical protein D3OALGB2SA_5601 [Olavius algarvensis associated proteobacterium Delta 3]|nr:hypothetical protein D3OALGB2SA_5601 [Olavius algarvensis associated proteobacterium Delta 3]